MPAVLISPPEMPASSVCHMTILKHSPIADEPEAAYQRCALLGRRVAGAQACSRDQMAISLPA